MGSGSLAAMSVFEDRYKQDMEVRCDVGKCKKSTSFPVCAVQTFNILPTVPIHPTQDTEQPQIKEFMAVCHGFLKVCMGSNFMRTS